MAGSTTPARGTRRFAGAVRLWRLEPALYAIFAGVYTLHIGCSFYASMHLQTLYAHVWHDPSALGGSSGAWSAPLDDVFIHFDFARSFARGFPFQWSEGNGYSSGGTSLLYPLALALGYWFGFRKLALMAWAAILAFVSTFAVLLAVRRMFRGLPRATSYLAPLALLCTGVLDWSLFSGMEVALFLAFWAATLIAWDDLLGFSGERSPPHGAAALLGLAGALLVGTRPEAITTVGIFAATAFLRLRRRLGTRPALGSAAIAVAPAVLVLVGHALANYWLTGDSTAAGARVKLELYHPFLTREQVFDAWWFHFKYQIFRITDYHLTIGGHTGWIPWAFAALALISVKTRRYALLLWLSSLAWIAMVALNGQVRWQNERYTMPAVAWMLLAASLGLGAALTVLIERWHGALRQGLRLAAVASVALFVYNERPRFREQLWFFGRASRNILDQHVRVGTLLAHYLQPQPTRVLVGDAGAIPYASDLPALDIIGLGGYQGLPFARATQYGVAAAVELIERMPGPRRPDVLAIYPSWWGAFPLWFGERIPGGEVPVRGNVICGGPSKVIYRANWSSLRDSARVFSLAANEHVVDTLDFADLISEHEHGYALSAPAIGHVEMKMLAHPREPQRDLWDAGRILPPGVSESFVLRGFHAGKRARLVLRVAPASSSALAVEVNAHELGVVELSPSDHWRELSVPLPANGSEPTLHVRLGARRGEAILYHLWALEAR